MSDRTPPANARLRAAKCWGTSREVAVALGSLALIAPPRRGGNMFDGERLCFPHFGGVASLRSPRTTFLCSRRRLL